MVKWIFPAIVPLATATQSCAFLPPPTPRHIDRRRHRRHQTHHPAPPLFADQRGLDNGASGSEVVREGSLADATKKLGKVPYGETSRKYRRTVFRHQDWVTHRSSSSRIVANLQSLLFSGVVRQLKPQVTAVSAVSALALAWNYLATADLPVDHLELHVLALPTLPFTLSSPALGLLLVFRTNAAYARWMCSRDAWVRITSHAKNMVRMATVFSSDPDAVEDLSKVVWLYCRSVMNKLSSPEEDDLIYREQVREIFGDSPVGEKITSSPDPAMSAWKEVSIRLHSLPTPDPKALIETDKSIIILGECTATCEKIYASPVPLVYTRHTARYLSMWALLLPFALYSAFDGVGQTWATLPASAIIAFFLFGVDELALQLEEPFSILPMQAFCDEIRTAHGILLGKEEARELRQSGLPKM